MPFGTVKLNDGREMPTIAYGTGSKWKGHDVTTYVEQAIDVGFSHIDTAQFYGTEEFVGSAIKESGLARSELFITTKYSGLGTASDAIQASLEKLGLAFVDLYLIHNPRLLDNIAAVWAQFESFQKAGFAKSIGVSNFQLDQLKPLVASANVVPAVNQIFFNPYNYAENKELLEFSQKHGIVTEAYSSLAPITRYPGGPVDKPVNAAAKRLGATPTQVILSWVRSKGVVIVTTSSTKAHMKEYLDVADLPSLTDDEITAIDEGGKNGPPSELRIFLYRASQRWRLLVFFLFIYLFFWGPALLARIHIPIGCHKMAQA
ncbi:aldo/keto reductase [Phanerochaete sordida]|uniref:Aldo/keto reductase n=1 Tax=Phanerochaete sordida TaxID=48140 RepID=A0A9P3LJB4_9APHY|nr:aldo/keto reductase [Phanerochaete sordida]